MNIEQPNSQKRHRKLKLPNGYAEIWLEQAGDQVNFIQRRPNGSGHGTWKRCDTHGCLGKAVIGNSKCLQHAEKGDVENYLKEIVKTGKPLSLAGVEVSQELVDFLFRSPVVEDYQVMVPLDFIGADISARFNLAKHTFQYWISFDGAIVRRHSGLNNCIFHERVSARFSFFYAGALNFTDSKFSRDADFSFVHTERVSMGFTSCSFDSQLLADGINGAFLLKKCYIKDNLSISNAQAQGIILDSCEIDGKLTLDNTNASFFRAPNLKAKAAHQIGPMQIENDFNVSQGQFENRIQLDISAQNLVFSGTKFAEGGQIFADGSNILLNQLSTGKPLRVTGINNKQPKIISLEDADAGKMTLSNVDMRPCFFYGARNIQNIYLEPTVLLAIPPTKWYSRRHCTADEIAWRVRSSKWPSNRWENYWHTFAFKPEGLGPEGTIPLPELEASQIANVYRDLRHSFEAKKDITGAADFYYGEMEMRRHNRQSSLFDRVIIFLYWLISGYGLRASRALISLIMLIATGTIVMYLWGFDPQSTQTSMQVQPTINNSLLFAFRATIPGLRDSSNTLTLLGEWVENILSILGPVVAALMALAIRERIKR